MAFNREFEKAAASKIPTDAVIADWRMNAYESRTIPPFVGTLMDRIDAMKVFVAALDEGSLAGASRKLGKSPAAVSRAIAFLENHVGVELLHRRRRLSLKFARASSLERRARDHGNAPVNDSAHFDRPSRFNWLGSCTIWSNRHPQ